MLQTVPYSWLPCITWNKTDRYQNKTYNMFQCGNGIVFFHEVIIHIVPFPDNNLSCLFLTLPLFKIPCRKTGQFKTTELLHCTLPDHQLFLPIAKHSCWNFAPSQPTLHWPHQLLTRVCTNQTKPSITITELLTTKIQRAPSGCLLCRVRDRITFPWGLWSTQTLE